MGNNPVEIKIIYSRAYDRNNFYSDKQMQHKNDLKMAKKFWFQNSAERLFKQGNYANEVNFRVDHTIVKDSNCVEYRVLGFMAYNNFYSVNYKISHDIYLRVTPIKQSEKKLNN